MGPRPGDWCVLSQQAGYFCETYNTVVTGQHKGLKQEVSQDGLPLGAWS